MFWNNTNNQDKFYNFVDKQERFKQRVKIIPVDFEKPWWNIILQQKRLISFAMFSQFIGSVFDSLFPIFLATAVNNLDIQLFLIVLGVKLAIIWIYNIMLRFNAVFQIQTMGSVELSANQFFLTVDPIFHTMKSSGKIISKIGRGSSSYEDILDLISFDLLSIVTSLITVSIAMFTFGWQLGLTSLGFILFIGMFNIVAQIFRTKTFQPRRIKAEDRFKAVSVETLLQAPFVRAIFASNEQLEKTKRLEIESMTKQGNAWMAGTYVNVITRTIYTLSVVTIGIMTLLQAKTGGISPIIALSIILTYSNGTAGILTVGNNVKRLTTALSNITDLFDFIRGFGKQTFPVLEENTKLKLKK